MTRPNPFALSTCGNFVVERLEGEIYPTVMTLDEAIGRQRRAEIQGAAYEREADQYASWGPTSEGEISRSLASVALTIAAEIAEALNGATGSLSDRRAA
jgi:hypothetical protein